MGGLAASGLPNRTRPGVADCPYEFYRNWVQNAAKTQEKVESITRKGVGTAQCPIPGMPHEEVVV